MPYTVTASSAWLTIAATTDVLSAAKALPGLGAVPGRCQPRRASKPCAQKRRFWRRPVSGWDLGGWQAGLGGRRRHCWDLDGPRRQRDRLSGVAMPPHRTAVELRPGFAIRKARFLIDGGSQDKGTTHASKDFYDPVKDRRILWVWGTVPSGIQTVPRELTYHPGCGRPETLQETLEWCSFWANNVCLSCSST